MTDARALDDLRRRALDAGLEAGLAAVGVAPATPFDRARRVLEERRDAGLHGGMAFTYRRPERATDPGATLPGAQALVVGAYPYARADVDPPAGHGPLGRVARYSWRDHYADLRAALDSVHAVLVGDGFAATVLADSNALVDREAAYRAGLGWYGKSTNLLLPGRGSWFVLGAVLTDAPLEPDAGPVADGCGTCTRCVPACPTGAIVAPGVLDARRCLAWLLEAPGRFPPEHRVALGDRIYGCDDCQEVCPPNRAAARHDPPPVAGEADEPWIPLLELLDAPDDDLLGRVGRWYVPRRQARYVRRNALVALGNVGDRGDRRVRAAVRRCLADPDPVVRGHAVWAARRIGGADLADAVGAVADAERHPDVLVELAAPVPVRS